MSEAETMPPTAQNIRAAAHNALMEALPEWMPLSDRVRVSDAVVAAVDPLIRASERDRILTLAAKFKAPLVQDNGYPVEAIPWAAFLDLLAIRKMEGK